MLRNQCLSWILSAVAALLLAGLPQVARAESHIQGKKPLVLRKPAQNQNVADLARILQEGLASGGQRAAQNNGGGAQQVNRPGLRRTDAVRGGLVPSASSGYQNAAARPTATGPSAASPAAITRGGTATARQQYGSVTAVKPPLKNASTGVFASTAGLQKNRTSAVPTFTPASNTPRSRPTEQYGQLPTQPVYDQLTAADLRNPAPSPPGSPKGTLRGPGTGPAIYSKLPGRPGGGGTAAGPVTYDSAFAPLGGSAVTAAATPSRTVNAGRGLTRASAPTPVPRGGFTGTASNAGKVIRAKTPSKAEVKNKLNDIFKNGPKPKK